MRTPTRRHRSSDKPVARHRIIAPYDIDDRYIEVLRRLEPYHHFMYATIPWLHYLTNFPAEYSVFRKYLGFLRQAPNFIQSQHARLRCVRLQDEMLSEGAGAQDLAQHP
jgi:hypothetical protein